MTHIQEEIIGHSYNAVPRQSHLFSKPSPVLLRVLELKRFAKQWVERLQEAVVGAGIGGHSKGSHIQHALDALWGFGGGLQSQPQCHFLLRFEGSLYSHTASLQA